MEAITKSQAANDVDGSVRAPWGSLDRRCCRTVPAASRRISAALEGAPFLHQGDLDGLVAQGTQADRLPVP